MSSLAEDVLLLLLLGLFIVIPGVFVGLILNNPWVVFVTADIGIGGPLFYGLIVVIHGEGAALC